MSGVVNIELLEEKMKCVKCSIETLSEAIGMDRSTFYRKMKCQGKGFTVKDIHGMCDALNLSDDEAKNIFFARTVA